MTFLLRRLAFVALTLVGSMTIVFFAMRLIPGDPVRLLAGEFARAEDIARTRQAWGFDRPLPLQYVQFVVNFVRGDLGTSVVSRQPVLPELGKRFFKTGILALVSFGTAVAMGMLAGIVAGTLRGSVLDRLITATSVLGFSVPSFWLGLGLIWLFSVRLGLFPAIGSSTWIHYILPAITLSLAPFALIARQTRSAILEVLGEDFVRTAHAKGLSRAAVIVGHTVRNALVPVVTLVGLSFGTLLGGSVVVETVFSWPGIGKWVLDAILARDYAVVQAVVILYAATFGLLNLATDLVLTVIDPRVRHG